MTAFKMVFLVICVAWSLIPRGSLLGRIGGPPLRRANRRSADRDTHDARRVLFPLDGGGGLAGDVIDHEVETVKARDRLALELHGQYARLDFPPEDPRKEDGWGGISNGTKILA